MAVFSNTIITKRGNALVAKGMAGEQINFTKVRTSDYDYPSSTNFENLTVLGSIKQTVDISAVNIENESTVRVKAAILNTDLTSGYYVKNIGLYANDPDEGEILFSITTASTSDFMAAYNGVNTTVLTVDLLTTVSNSGNVNLTVSPGGLVTTEMIATETERGIISGLDIRSTEAAYITGAAYGDVFGTTLTSIEKGKVYYYWDSMKKTYIPYESLNTITKTDGFITPDAVNFKDISNTKMAYIIFKNTSNYKIYIDRQTNILHLLKKSVEIITLEEVVTQILNVTKNSDYTVNQWTVLANFNIALNTSTAKVYNGYGIFLSISNEIVFFYGEDNTRVENNALFYFHSGEITIQMQVK